MGSLSSQNVHKSFTEMDFFRLCKLENLPDTEKQKQLIHFELIAISDMAYGELPELLSSEDLKQLDELTKKKTTLDVEQIKQFLREKVKQFDDLFNEKISQIKAGFIKRQYEILKEILPKVKSGEDSLFQLVPIERILAAIETNNWPEVELIVSQLDLNPTSPTLTLTTK